MGVFDGLQTSTEWSRWLPCYLAINNGRGYGTALACRTPIQQLGLLWARERPGELTHLNKNLRDQRFAKNHNSVLIQALENGSFDRLLNQPFANSFYKWMSASFALRAKILRSQRSQVASAFLISVALGLTRLNPARPAGHAARHQRSYGNGQVTSESNTYCDFELALAIAINRFEVRNACWPKAITQSALQSLGGFLARVQIWRPRMNASLQESAPVLRSVRRRASVRL